MAVKKSAKRAQKRSAQGESAKKTAAKKTAAKKTSRKTATKKVDETTPVKKKAAKKKAGEKQAGAKRGPGRPPGGNSKTRGSLTSRRQIKQIAKRILQESDGCTREEASARTGAYVDDIKNLKAGNLPSLKLILRVVREGRFDPHVLIHKLHFKKLPTSVSTAGARSALISGRIRKIAKEQEPAVLAEKTGLSIYTIYQHRVANKRVGLHTILAFIDAGVVTAPQVFLGLR